MRYISIDIETAGLDPKSDVLLEIGAVAMDGPTELGSIRILLPRDRYNVTPFIMKMHAKLFEDLHAALGTLGKDMVCYCHGDEGAVFAEWCRSLGWGGKILVAGKNFFAFDYLWLKGLRGFPQVSARYLDPGSMYLRAGDTMPPSLAECCERAGVELIDHHSAVADARTVARLISKRLYDGS